MGNFIEPIKAMMGQVSMDKVIPPYMSNSQAQVLLGVPDSTMKQINSQTGNMAPALEKDLGKLGATTGGINNSTMFKEIQQTLEKLFSSYQGFLGGTGTTSGTSSTTGK